MLGVLSLFLLVGCKQNQSDEKVSADTDENEQITEESSHIREDTLTNDIDPESNYEGEWYRTDVPSYQWARIAISDWEEKSFKVTLDAVYLPYSGNIEGIAEFIEPDIAVLYDEDVENSLQNHEGDHGIYFQFIENSIIVTHDSYVRLWFGGGGIGTAEGTYIQGKPEYTNCTDVSEIFTENELEIIQGLLGDRYEELFKNMIELGEITEYKITNGRLWEAYKQPYASEWCNIIIYDDGNIYIEGYSGSVGTIEFYTNSEDTEMPDIDLLKK